MRTELRWLLLLSLAEIATMLTFGSYSGALPVLRHEWGLTAAQAGAVFAGQQIGYALAVLVLSTLTDVIGVRTIYSPPRCGTAWRGCSLPGSHGTSGRGTSLSLFLTGAILPFGWRTVFFVTALGPLAAAALAWPIVRDTPRQTPHRRIAIGQALRNVRAMRFISAYAAHNWELFGMRAWLPAFLTSLWMQQGLPLTPATARGAAFSSVVLLASGVSNALGGRLSDSLGRRRTIVLFLTASAAVSATIGWSAPLGLGVVLALAVLYGLLVTAESSTLSTAVAESAHPEVLGATMAVQSSLGFLVTAISPPLFGAILDLTGGTWGWAFSSLGVAALLGVLAVVRLKQRGSPQLGPDRVGLEEEL